MTSRYRNWLILTLTLFVWLSASIAATPYGFAQSAKWLTPTAPVVSWTDASSYVGQTVAIEGTIVYTYYSSYSGTSFLDFHYPYQGYFYGVVFSSDAGNFKCSITDFYLNKDVRIIGPVQLYNGAPEIIVSSPSQVEVAYQGFPCS
ncbi:MAG: hypothetical protein ACLP9D_03195 [Candidatus Bathyarchaeia archaeon]